MQKKVMDSSQQPTMKREALKKLPVVAFFKFIYLFIHFNHQVQSKKLQSVEKSIWSKLLQNVSSQGKINK